MTTVDPANIAILGSCITRDNFNTKFNPDYKGFYTCSLMQNQMSIISLMSEPFALTDEQYGSMSAYDQWNVRTDLNKEFLAKVVEEQPEYLILDFFGDIHFGCLRLEDGRYITNNRWKLWQTGFYKELKAQGKIDPFRIEIKTEAYVQEWQRSFDRLRDYLRAELPETTVIVHRGRNTDSLQLPGQPDPISLQENRKKAKLDVLLANELWSRLDDYAASTPGYEVIDLTDREYPTYDDHPWGPFYVHYTMDYYSDFMTALHKIHLRHARTDADPDLPLRVLADVERLATVGPNLALRQVEVQKELQGAELEQQNQRIGDLESDAAQAAAAPAAPAAKAPAKGAPAKKAPAKKAPAKKASPKQPPSVKVRIKRKIRRGMRRIPIVEQQWQRLAQTRRGSATAPAGTDKAAAKKAAAKKAPATKAPAKKAPVKKAPAAPAAKPAPKPVKLGPVTATVSALRWLSPTSCELTGWVFSKGVSATAESRPDLSIWARRIDGEGRVDFAVTPGDAVGATLAADDPKIDYRGSGFRAVVDLSAVTAADQGPWRVEFGIRAGESSFDGIFATRVPQGSAARLLVSDISADRQLQPVWSLRDGLTFQCQPRTTADTHSGHTGDGSRAMITLFALDRATATVKIEGTVEGAEPDGWRFELRGPQGIIPLADQHWRSQEFTVTAPLTFSAWGGAAGPLMLGTYDLWILDAGGLPVTPVLADSGVRDLPDELVDDRISVMLIRTAADRPQIQLKSPLRPDEIGKFAQGALDARYQKTDVVPDGSVYFESFYGRNASDSPRAIHDELVRMGSNRTMYWAVADYSVPVPEGSIPVVIRSREWWDLLARCSYFIHNEGTPPPLRKREDQVVVQTWHGTPLKLLGYDRPLNRNTPGWQERMAKSTAKWDFMIAGNTYSADIFRQAYCYQGNMLDLGYPRNDVLVNADADTVQDIRRRLGIEADQKVVLYAPTWRDGEASVVGYLDLEQLTEELGPGHVVLVRGHTNTLRNAQRLSGSRVIDVTSYPLVNDLFLVADLMITDYSSVMFDYSVTNKPMLFYVPDFEDYQGRRRGTYFDLAETSPGPLLSNPEELVEAVRNIDQVHQSYTERYAAWRLKFNARDDGQAARRVIETVFPELNVAAPAGE